MRRKMFGKMLIIFYTKNVNIFLISIGLYFLSIIYNEIFLLNKNYLFHVFLLNYKVNSSNFGGEKPKNYHLDSYDKLKV